LKSSRLGRTFSFNTNAVNYYRLKITDIDGKITYSRVISLINKTSGIVFNSIMPSLVMDNTILVLSAAKTESINLVITDMNGRVVTQLNRKVVAGTNNIELNIASLQAGIYLVNGTTATEKTPAIRFVKQ
jgi:Secretion system C-terminal sorting domain